MNPTADPTRAPATRRRRRSVARLPVAPRGVRRRRRGGSTRWRAEGRPQLLELGALHRHAVVAQGRRHDRPDDARAVHDEDRASRSTTTRTSTRTRSTSRRCRDGSRSGRASGATSSCRPTTTAPRRVPRNDWAQKLDKSLIPNISNLIDAQASPPFDPNREYTLPWLSGMDGSRGTTTLTGPVTTVTQLFEDPKLKGKVGVWNSMGDTLGLVMLDNGDDPAKVTDASFDRALVQVQKAVGLGPDPPVLRQRLRAPLANGRPRRDHGVVGDIVSSLENPKLTGHPREGRDHLDRQHVHSARRQRADRVDVHELRLRPEDRSADRCRHQLHLRRSRASRRMRRRSTRSRRRTRSIFPTTRCLRRSTRTTRRCSPTRTTSSSGSR